MPFAWRGEARAQTSRGAQRVGAPRVERGRRAAAEDQQFRHREHRGRLRWIVRHAPCERARSPAVEVDLVRERAGGVASCGEAGHALTAAVDQIRDAIAIGVQQSTLVHHRDRSGEPVALHEVEHGRFRHAIDTDAAQRQRRHRHVERERRADQMPWASPRLDRRDAPHRFHARVAARHVVSEVVTARGIAGDQNRPVRIAEVAGVRQREQRAAEHRVGDRRQRRDGPPGVAEIRRPLDRAKRPRCLAQAAHGRLVGGTFGCCEFCRRGLERR